MATVNKLFFQFYVNTKEIWNVLPVVAENVESLIEVLYLLALDSSLRNEKSQSVHSLLIRNTFQAR